MYKRGNKKMCMLKKLIQKVAVIYLSTIISYTFAQDYDVSDIQCSFLSQGIAGVGDTISATLKRPNGFKGSPLFADDRSVNPQKDRSCSIKPDEKDPAKLTYKLRILDFSKCGVLKRNGFVHVRIWFPQFPGVVMQSDQELIIMCKPPEPTIIQNKAAGFAGSFPNGARVSGIVEETSGRLEYEVALYKEAPATISNKGLPLGGNNNLYGNHSAQALVASQNELPLDQAVPIGTKLQLRARISLQNVWKNVKLMEVTVSPDADNAHAPGSVQLVKEGCRNKDFSSIIPHQPARYRERPNEVYLDFEAFLLSSMKERSTLWIHSQIKACVDAADCKPDFCLDLYEQSGHGRRRRREITATTNSSNGLSEFTKFKQNIEYTVLMPSEYDDERILDSGQCRQFANLSMALAVLLAFSTVITCTLAFKIQSSTKKNIDDYATNGTKGYSGRAIVQ